MEEESSAFYSDKILVEIAVVNGSNCSTSAWQCLILHYEDAAMTHT